MNAARRAGHAQNYPKLGALASCLTPFINLTTLDLSRNCLQVEATPPRYTPSPRWPRHEADDCDSNARPGLTLKNNVHAQDFRGLQSLSQLQRLSYYYNVRHAASAALAAAPRALPTKLRPYHAGGEQCRRAWRAARFVPHHRRSRATAKRAAAG